MMNSFIIKNADQSFDNYYQSIKKRAKHITHSLTQQEGSPIAGSKGVTDSQGYGRMRGKRPAARDGHTGLVIGRQLIIFGGDRHHMPFNDMFALDIKSEIAQKSFLF